jgi:hypothetical protein
LTVQGRSRRAPWREWGVSSLVNAAARRDLEVLWSLTQAHDTRRAGTSSVQTLRRYQLGPKRWLTYTASRAVGVLRPKIENAKLRIREVEGSGLKPSSVGIYLK